MNRYSRQEIFIGSTAQEKLRKTSIAIIGCGALGSVAAELLARSGVGEIFLYDRDIVELVNLQRQSCYTQEDINKPKATALQKHLQRINSDITIHASTTHINKETIKNVKADIIIDGTDNIETRDVIDAYCLEQHIPWIMGSGIRDRGYVMTIFPGGPRYRDAFPKAAQAESCEEFGVLAPTTHIIASLQVVEAFKLIFGTVEEQRETKLHSLSVYEPSISSFTVKKRRHLEETADTAPYHIRHCRSKKGIVVQPSKHLQLNLDALRETYPVLVDTELVLILEGDIYVYSYGEIIFKQATSLEEAKKTALDLYKQAGVEFS
jgi:adenylyltransferase/sulfurtransferase